MRIAYDDRKSEQEIKYIKLRCEYLQSRYGYSPNEWALVLANMSEDDPDYDCVWGIVAGAFTSFDDMSVTPNGGAYILGGAP